MALQRALRSVQAPRSIDMFVCVDKSCVISAVAVAVAAVVIACGTPKQLQAWQMEATFSWML